MDGRSHENLTEARTLDWLYRSFPANVTAHFPRSYGLVPTDMGLGHLTELICDKNSSISSNLEQYLAVHGHDAPLRCAIEDFKEHLRARMPRTRNLLPHNLVVQRQSDRLKIWMIDGFGRIPALGLFEFEYARRRMYQKRMTYLFHPG